MTLYVLDTDIVTLKSERSLLLLSKNSSLVGTHSCVE
jgi:hypothetical protein